jgi:thermopsin
MTDKTVAFSIAVALVLVISGAFAFAVTAVHPAGAGTNAVAYALSGGIPGTGVKAGDTASSSGTPVSGAAAGAGPYPASTAVTSPYITAAEKAGVPLQYVYIPAPKRAPVVNGNVVMPGYEQGPAPFGIGAYGIRNVSGTLEPFMYTTTAFNSSFNATQLNAFDVNSFDPNGLTVQLNAVLTGTTVEGVTGYTYWTQNVMFYDSYAHQFEMVDNIWNFSSPGATMPSSTIYSHTAAQIPYPYAYIAVGPVVNNVSTPFVANLSLQSAVVGGMSTVFFNFTLTFTNHSTDATQTISGVFDEVQFNSLNGVLGYAAPLPLYRVDGGNVTPTGYIPYDAEVGIIGPGGGSQINIQTISGTLNLDYKNAAGRMVTVPSAYDIGSETGETSTGIAEAWQPTGTVTLSSGPSLVYGMWNITPFSGVTHYTGTVSPANAFMFVSPGSSLSLGQYGYVTTSTGGRYSFWLPTGTYSQGVMMSYRNPEFGPLSTSENIILTMNSSLGIYTPLYAMGNAEAANISLSGSGTVVNPYLAYSNQPGFISPYFGMMNDYGFPVFSGVQMVDTSVNINFNNSPSFSILYEQPQTSLYLGALYFVPSLNNLGYVFYNTSNLSVYGAKLITGTIPADYAAGFYGANIMMWNSTHDLIANSTFVGTRFLPYQFSILIYDTGTANGTNVLFGNYFLDSSFSVGVGIAGSGNLIFNNYFDDHLTDVHQFGYNLYTGAPVLYSDTWNVTPVLTSTFVYHFNGYNLQGNIVGNSTMGGNFWNTFVPGVSTLPFNDNGAIFVGGDYAPVTYSGTANAPYVPIIFYETGLAGGQSWSVNLSGYVQTTTSDMMVFYALPYASYSYTVQSVPGYIEFFGATGSVSASEGANVVSLLYLPYYTITLKETGLPPGYSWAGLILYRGGFPVIGNFSSTNEMTIEWVPGTWFLGVTPTGNYYNFPEYYSYSFNLTIIPLFGNVTLTLNMAPIYNNFTFIPANIAAGTPWSVTVWMLLHGGAEVPVGTFYSTNTTLTVPLIEAQYGYSFSSDSYYESGGNPSIFEFSPYSSPDLVFYVYQGYPLTFDVTNLPPGTQWSLEVYAFNTNYYQTLTTSSGSVTVTVPADTLGYLITPANSSYQSYSNNILVTAPETVDVALALSPNAMVTVTFSESGLASGASWQVTFNGQTQSSTAATISFTATPGTYYYQAYSNGSVSPQSSGSLNVQKSMSVDISFYAQTYTVTFIAAGIPSGTAMTLTFNGRTVTTTSQVAGFIVPAGTYSFTAKVKGYTLSSSTATISVGQNTIVLLQFKPAAVASSASLLVDSGLLILGLVVGAVVAYAVIKHEASRKKGKGNQ